MALNHETLGCDATNLNTESQRERETCLKYLQRANLLDTIIVMSTYTVQKNLNSKGAYSSLYPGSCIAGLTLLANGSIALI